MLTQYLSCLPSLIGGVWVGFVERAVHVQLPSAPVIFGVPHWSFTTVHVTVASVLVMHCWFVARRHFDAANLLVYPLALPRTAAKHAQSALTTPDVEPAVAHDETRALSLHMVLLRPSLNAASNTHVACAVKAQPDAPRHAPLDVWAPQPVVFVLAAAAQVPDVAFAHVAASAFAAAQAVLF